VEDKMRSLIVAVVVWIAFNLMIPVLPGIFAGIAGFFERNAGSRARNAFLGPVILASLVASAMPPPASTVVTLRDSVPFAQQPPINYRSITIGLPSDVRANDLVLILTLAPGTHPTGPCVQQAPAGWIVAWRVLHIMAIYETWTAGSDTTATISISDGCASTAFQGYVADYYNSSTGQPLSVGPTSTAEVTCHKPQADPMPLTAPGIQTTVANTKLVFLGTSHDTGSQRGCGDAGGAIVWIDPSGFTREGFQRPNGDGETYFADKTKGPAGATGDVTAYVNPATTHGAVGMLDITP
jgi:hypothetical protein